MNELLAAYRKQHAEQENNNRRGNLGANCVKDEFGDTRCELCKKYDRLKEK